MSDPKDKLFSDKYLGITWYWGVKDSQPLKKVIALRDETKPTHILIAAQRSKGRNFAFIDPKILPDLISKDRHIYEIIEPDQPRKVYFDIDKTGAGLEEIKDRIRTIFPDAQFAISGNHETPSYHILLTNYHYNNVLDIRDLQTWCRLDEQSLLGFDPAPYSKNQQFKCIGQSKVGGKTQTYIEGPTDLISHIVCHIDPSSKEASTHGLLRKEPKELKDIDLTCVPQRRLPIPDELVELAIDFKSAPPDQILRLIPNPPRSDNCHLHHPHTTMIMCYARRNGISYEEFWEWAKSKDDSQKRHDKILRHWTVHPNWYVKTTHILNLLERTYPGISKPKWTTRHKQALSYTPTLVLEERYMTAAHIPPKRVVALGQGMGANKTGAVIDYLGDSEFIWITPRITLAKNTHGRFPKELHVSYYRDLSRKEKLNDIRSKKRLIIGAQSLHYLEDLSLEEIQERTVVIDEIEFVMCDWMNETHKYWHETNWKVFLKLTQNCKKFIAMDAFLSKLSLDFLRELPGDLEIINRKPVPQTISITELSYKADKKKTDEPWPEIAAFISHIGETLRSGKKCFVFYPYKMTSNSNPGIQSVCDSIAYYAGLGPEESLCYFAESDDSVLNGLSKVAEQWAGVRLVITNSKITVGVNYDGLGYDVCYIAKAPFNSPREITQVSARIRHLGDAKIYLMYIGGHSPKNYELPPLKCPIFSTLKDNYAVEFHTRDSREICNVFFELARYKIDITQVRTDINRENFQYVSSCDAAFLWDNIQLLSSYASLEDIQAKCYMGNASQQDKLVLDKYNFISQFSTEASIERLASIWDSRCVSMVYKHIAYLKEGPRGLLNKAYSDLGIRRLGDGEEGAPLWDPKKKLSEDTKTEIFSRYSLDTYRDSSDYVIMNELLSTYYAYKILGYDRKLKKWHVAIEFQIFSKFVEDNVDIEDTPPLLMLE